MTDKELLALATEFDGGMQPILNGTYVTPEHIAYWMDSHNHHDSVSLRINDKGVRKWAVIRGSMCLNKKLQWVYQSLPSNRTDKWLAQSRFDSIEEAFEALRKAHEKERQEWIKKIGRGKVPTNRAEEKELHDAWRARVQARQAKKNSALQSEKKG